MAKEGLQDARPVTAEELLADIGEIVERMRVTGSDVPKQLGQFPSMTVRQRKTLAHAILLFITAGKDAPKAGSMVAELMVSAIIAEGGSMADCAAFFRLAPAAMQEHLRIAAKQFLKSRHHSA